MKALITIILFTAVSLCVLPIAFASDKGFPKYDYYPPGVLRSFEDQDSYYSPGDNLWHVDKTLVKYTGKVETQRVHTFRVYASKGGKLLSEEEVTKYKSIRNKVTKLEHSIITYGDDGLYRKIITTNYDAHGKISSMIEYNETPTSSRWETRNYSNGTPTSTVMESTQKYPNGGKALYQKLTVTHGTPGSVSQTPRVSRHAVYEEWGENPGILLYKMITNEDSYTYKGSVVIHHVETKQTYNDSTGKYDFEKWDYWTGSGSTIPTPKGYVPAPQPSPSPSAAAALSVQSKAALNEITQKQAVTAAVPSTGNIKTSSQMAGQTAKEKLATK